MLPIAVKKQYLRSYHTFLEDLTDVDASVDYNASDPNNYRVVVKEQAQLPFTSGIQEFANVYSKASGFSSGNFDLTSSTYLLQNKTYGDMGIGYQGPVDLVTGGLNTYNGLLANVVANWGTMYDINNIDTIAEKLRTIRATMPTDLSTVIGLSPINDLPVTGDADELLSDILSSIETMIDQYHELNDAAESIGYIDIANFSQDQIGQLAKFRWMVEATLDE